MKAHARITLAFLAAALLAGPVAAQTLRPASNNGALVAPGASGPRVQLIVRDNGGNPRAGVTVNFQPTCVDRLRGDVPPYACVTTVEPLAVVTNASGIASSPLYVADLQPGNAWLTASAELDGVAMSLPFYYRVGSSAPSPLQIVTGNNQVVQVGFPIAESLRARVIDDRGRAIPGVPVTFTSTCAAGVPCLLPPTATPRLVSDNLGYVDSEIRVANSVPGAYSVPLSIVGGGATFNFQITNVGAVRSATITTQLGDRLVLQMVSAPATCSITLAEGLQRADAPPPPGLLAVPRSPIRLVIENCPAGGTVAFQMQHPGGLPEGAQVWAARPTWQPLETDHPIEGFWEFALVDGGAGDADTTANGRIEAVLAVAYGDPAAPRFQDLWWVGPSENGWGVSIVQHGNRLFIVIFGYDTAGEPTWYVMPGGTWNAAGNAFTGSLYRPRGRPIAEHVASDLVVGAPAGSATLEFADLLSARLILRFGTTEHVKYITRQLFGARNARTIPPLGDMWWAGPSRNGWGLVLQQQRASLFGVLFTYRSDGSPMWFAFPAGTWIADDTYEGLAYRTRSSTWPAEYDPAQLTSEAVGAFRLRFLGDSATFDVNVGTGTSRFTLSRQPF